MSDRVQGVIIYHGDDGAAAWQRARRHVGLPGRRHGGRCPALDEPLAFGELRRVGTDPAGYRVFALARANLGRVAERALCGVAAAFGFGEDRVILIDVDQNGFGRQGATEGALPRWSAVPRGVAARSPWPAVIYTCFGSAHSSVVAAALHAGLLPFGRRPSPADLLALPDFDRLAHADVGWPLLIGIDSAGRPVLALGLMSGRAFLPRAIYDLLAAFGVPTGAVVFADALTGASPLLRASGFLSRRLGWVRLGRPLCVAAVQREYPRFERVVARVWRQVAGRGHPPWAALDGGVGDSDNRTLRFDAPRGMADNISDTH